MNKNVKELLILHFLNDGIRTTFTAMLPFIAKTFSFSLTSVGFLASSQSLIASLLALPTGFIASRIGGFRLLIFLIIIYSFGSLIVVFSPDFWLLIAGFFIAALGFGMFHTVGFSLVAKNSESENIGRNMGDFTSIGEIGRVAIPPIAVFVTSFLGWRVAMMGLAVIGFISYLLFHLFKPTKEIYNIDNEEKETHRDFIKNIMLLLKIKKFLLVLIASIVDSFASSSIYLFLSFFLLAKGMDIAAYGIATGLYFAGSLFGKSALGRSVDKIGNAKVFILSEVCMGLTLIILVLSSQALLLQILSFLLGAFTKGTSPVLQTMFSEIAHKAHYNKIYGIAELCIGGSAVITTILLGMIADRVGISYVFYICALFAVMATLPILAVSKIKTNKLHI